MKDKLSELTKREVEVLKLNCKWNVLIKKLHLLFVSVNGQLKIMYQISLKR